MRRAQLRKFLLSLILGAAAACGGEEAAGRLDLDTAAEALSAARDGLAAGCVREIERAPVVSDGLHMYVEADNLHAWGDTVLVVGTPSYDWVVSANRAGSLMGEPERLGVVVGPAGATPIPLPPGLPKPTWVRSTVLPTGGFGVLIDDRGDDPSAPEGAPRLVYAEYVGNEWTTVEALPLPDGGLVDPSRSSGLVATGDGVAFLAVVEAGQIASDLLLLRRGPGGWTSASVGEALVDAAVLAAYGGDLLFGTVGPETGRPGGLVSYTVRSAETGHTLHEISRPPEAGRPARPRLAASSRGPVMSWLNLGGAGGAWAGFTSPDSREVHQVLVDPDPLDAVLLVNEGGAALAVVSHRSVYTNRTELRVYRVTPNGSSLLGVIPSPYTGFFGAVDTGSAELLLVGPEYESGAAFPFVRSLLIRLSISC